MAGGTPLSDSPADRLRLTLELSEVADAMREQRLRREHPGLTEEEIEDEMARWRGTRPGAEEGDAPGRPVPWPRPR
ncbi:MAG: hypothetical protein EDX89_02725 [Acidobacteria bacterium]|nr:MAG: hypothetical protein EDX89_02725 [Acidobacteriota bacterium]